MQSRNVSENDKPFIWISSYWTFRHYVSHKYQVVDLLIRLIYNYLPVAWTSNHCWVDWQRKTDHTWAIVVVVGKSIATTAGAVVAVVCVDAHLSTFAVVVNAFVNCRVKICNRHVISVNNTTWRQLQRSIRSQSGNKSLIKCVRQI